MFRRWYIIALSTIWIGGSGAAYGAIIESFFGNDHPGTVRPLNIPNAQAARTAFLAGLVISLQDDFESYPGLSILITTSGGTVRVADSSISVPVPVSGSQFLAWLAGPSEDSFRWNVPAGNAFGFFGMDIGDGANENLDVRLHHADGGTTSVSVPHLSGGIASDALFFFGLVADKPFTQVEFVNDGTPFDFAPPGFGFDDFVAGTRAIAAIPEPASWILMVLGLALCAVVRCRRDLAEISPGSPASSLS